MGPLPIQHIFIPMPLLNMPAWNNLLLFYLNVAISFSMNSTNLEPSPGPLTHGDLFFFCTLPALLTQIVTPLSPAMRLETN